MGKDFESLQKISVTSSSTFLRINCSSAAAKTVVCYTAIPLGSRGGINSLAARHNSLAHMQVAGRDLTPPWTCGCLVALLMR